ncbi:MAG: hypothetical protein OH340_02740 [Candidatus Parvarchaeota archaeon]|nr:hypothetical protein [Candidatus Rehaiarchaeum fermentans]
MGEEVVKFLSTLFKDKPVAQNLKEIITIKALEEEGLRGILDVKENIINSIEDASIIAQNNRIPIITFFGPTGSGKNKIVEAISNIYLKGVAERKISVYSFEINGKLAPYKERPYNLFSTYLKDLDSLLRNNSDELTYNIYSKHKKSITNQVSNETLSMLENALYENPSLDKIKIEEITPRIVFTDINELKDTHVLYKSIKEANRGILVINADKYDFSSINANVFYTLSDIYDNNLFFDGSKVPLDLLVLLTTNQSDFKQFSLNNRPMLERMILVGVRRNLSWEEESKIISEIFAINKYENNDINHETVNRFLEYLSKFLIGSRFELLKSEKEKAKSSKLGEATYLFALYESYFDMLNAYDKGEDLSNIVTKFMAEEILEEGNKLSNFLRERIYTLKGQPYISYKFGSYGISSRRGLVGFKVRNNSINYFDMIKFFVNFEEVINKEGSDSHASNLKEILDYIITSIESDIRKDVEMELLRLKAEKYIGKNYSLDDLTNYLLGKEEGKVKDYESFIDLGLLSQGAFLYFSVKLPSSSIKRISLEDALKFSYIFKPGNSLLTDKPNEEEIKSVYNYLVSKFGNSTAISELWIYGSPVKEVLNSLSEDFTKIEKRVKDMFKLKSLN